jgi:hypothetical protein
LYEKKLQLLEAATENKTGHKSDHDRAGYYGGNPIPAFRTHPESQAREGTDKSN